MGVDHRALRVQIKVVVALTVGVYNLFMNSPSTLNILSGLCAQFFETKDWYDLIHQIIDSGLRVTSADRGTVFLASEYSGPRPNKTLKALVATGIKGESLEISADRGIAGYVFRNQLPMVSNDTSKSPYFSAETDEVTNYKTKTVLCVPLKTPAGKKIGALEFINSKNNEFSDEDLKAANILGLFAGLAIEQRVRLFELETKKNDLILERRRRLSGASQEGVIKTKSRALIEVFEKLEVYAQSKSNVLITGESGTGKELVAKYVHLNSDHNEGPFVVVNCAAIPESLFEAEIFGVAKGAATGTVARKGKIELSEGGTLFLDEIGEMPLSIQAKLLRVIQDKMVSRVGDESPPRAISFRLVAATNRDLKKMSDEKLFREDLYFRLNVLSVHLPPLSERLEDIEDISASLMDQFSRERGWKKKALSRGLLNAMRSYGWPGNIRELQNRIERAMILSGDKEVLDVKDFNLKSMASPVRSKTEGAAFELDLDGLTLKAGKDAVERALLIETLKRSEGNKSKASQSLGVSREGLRKALIKHELR